MSESTYFLEVSSISHIWLTDIWNKTKKKDMKDFFCSFCLLRLFEIFIFWWFWRFLVFPSGYFPMKNEEDSCFFTDEENAVSCYPKEYLQH